MEAVQATNADVDLLLADLMLPGMNGAELADVLRATQPDMRVIFMSGYEQDEIEARGIGSVGAGYVTKPFTADVLVMMVEGALAD